MNAFTAVSAVDYSTGIAKIGKCALEDKTALKQADIRSQGIAKMEAGRERKRHEQTTAPQSGENNAQGRNDQCKTAQPVSKRIDSRAHKRSERT